MMMPTSKGSVRRIPKFRPEAASIKLFGPGVMVLTSAKVAAAASRVVSMTISQLVQVWIKN